MKHSSDYAARHSIRLLADLTHRTQVVLTGRGAAGICAVLASWGFRDRVVLLPANTCYIVMWAVLASGNRPLLVDVDRQSGNLTVDGLNAALSADPAVVIPCHMYGLTAPMAAICAWAGANGVKVIEDAALALGAMVEGYPAGHRGDASIVSFGLGKIIDNQVGGALLTDDAALAAAVKDFLARLPVWDDRLMALTNQWNGLYWPLHQYEGQTPRLLDLYPALYEMYGGLSAYQLGADEWADLPGLLRGLPDNLARRGQLAALYDAQLGGIDSGLLAATQLARPSGSILWRYPLLVQPELRDDLLGYLWEAGIHEATRWYPPLRPMTVRLAPTLSQPETPAAEALGASIINLPLDAHTDEAEVRHIMGLIEGFWS